MLWDCTLGLPSGRHHHFHETHTFFFVIEKKNKKNNNPRATCCVIFRCFFFFFFRYVGYWMYCCKAVCRALLLSTPKQVNKNNDYISIQIHLFTVFVWSKNGTHFFFSLSPIPVRIRRQTEPQPTLRLCAVHFRRETYCRFQVLHSACIWKHRRSHSHISQKGWEEEN